jgi:hypothetical protein
VHQHFLDVGAMRLVGRRIEPELHGADDSSVEACRQKDDIPGRNTDFDLVKESARLVL